MVAGLVMTFLRRQLHERHARELLFTGDIIDAERAAEIGLVNRCVPTDVLDEAVEQAIDKRSSMAAIGNLNDYVKLQFAESLGKDRGGSGTAGSAAELAMGFGLAGQLMNQPGGILGAPQGTQAAAPTGAIECQCQ